MHKYYAYTIFNYVYCSVLLYKQLLRFCASDSILQERVIYIHTYSKTNFM